MKNLKRIFQLITGIHRIHHIYFNYGWKLPFVNVGYFPIYTYAATKGTVHVISRDKYHDCTLTNIY